MFSMLSRRSHLSASINNLQCCSLESRCLSDGLGLSSSNFNRGNTGCLKRFSYNLLQLQLVREFNPSSFYKYRQFSPFASQYIARPNSQFRIQHHYAAFASTEKKSRNMLMYLTALAFAMVGCSYAAVPLYRRFCQATGYGGTVQRRESVEEKIARHSKDGTISSRLLPSYFIT